MKEVKESERSTHTESTRHTSSSNHGRAASEETRLHWDVLTPPTRQMMMIFTDRLEYTVTPTHLHTEETKRSTRKIVN